MSATLYIALLVLWVAIFCYALWRNRKAPRQIWENNFRAIEIAMKTGRII